MRSLAENFELNYWLKLMMVVLPIVSGVFLTLNNAFSPMAKWDAMRWAAAMCDSETYSYRARAGNYASTDTSDSWQTPGFTETKSASKRYVDKIREVKTKVAQENLHTGCCTIQYGLISRETSSADHLSFDWVPPHDSHTEPLTAWVLSRYTLPKKQAKQVKKRVKKLFEGEVLSSDTTSASAEGDNTLRAGQDGYRQKLWVKDDGFSQLTAEQYLVRFQRSKYIMFSVRTH